jgi:hypothetical protein
MARQTGGPPHQPGDAVISGSKPRDMSLRE